MIVGGELTLDTLEIRHDPGSNVSEAPLQLKSNCGCLLIDDFGRQRIEPTELLNRWIIPLENRHDFLTLATGKKIQVPFEQLIIFSTNLEPTDLADEAFLRRIPYKIEVHDPTHRRVPPALRDPVPVVPLRVPPRRGGRPDRTPLRAVSAGRCGAAIPATCCCRSATTARTTTCRWR